MHMPCGRDGAVHQSSHASVQPIVGLYSMHMPGTDSHCRSLSESSCLEERSSTTSRTALRETTQQHVCILHTTPPAQEVPCWISRLKISVCLYAKPTATQCGPGRILILPWAANRIVQQSQRTYSITHHEAWRQGSCSWSVLRTIPMVAVQGLVCCKQRHRSHCATRLSMFS